MNEFRYLHEKEMDTLASFVWQLAQELHTTRRRLLVLEDLLATSGVIGTDAMERHHPDAESTERLVDDGKELLERLVRPLTDVDDHRAPMREQFLTRLTGEGD